MLGLLALKSWKAGRDTRSNASFVRTHTRLLSPSCRVKVNPHDATLLRAAMLTHPPSPASWEQLAVCFQLSQSDIVGNTCNTTLWSSVEQGSTAPCFMEQSCIVWTDLNSLLAGRCCHNLYKNKVKADDARSNVPLVSLPYSWTLLN